MQWTEIITEYLLDITVKGYSERTIASQQHKLKRVYQYFNSEGADDPLKVTNIELKKYILQLKQTGNAHSTINGIISVIKKLYDYAVDEEYILASPVKLKNLKEEKKLIYPLNDSEIKQMIIFSRSHHYKLLKARNPLIFMTMLDCGLRIGEVENLNESDILQNQLRIRKAKGNKERAVALSPVLKKEFMKYLRVKHKLGFKDEAVFVTYTGNRMSRENIWQIMNQMAKKIKVRPEVRFSPHTLRHTYAAMQLRNGLDVFTLSLNMGHENVSITQDYIRSLRSEDFIEKSVKSSTLMNLK